MRPSSRSRPTSGIDAETRAILVEALPYIQAFAGAIVVVKFGGNAMVDEALAESFAEDIVLLRSVGLQPVVVHGGGPQIGDLMARLGMEPQFVDGLRVTDAETLDIARMVLVGKVNRDLVSAINRARPAGRRPLRRGRRPDRGPPATPSSASSATSTMSTRTLARPLLADGFIPVISTIGTDGDGQAYNINADSAAIAIAEASRAEKLIYLTDVRACSPTSPTRPAWCRRSPRHRARLLIDDGVVRRDDPEDRGVHRCGRGRGRLGPHPRRADPPRRPARAVHRRRRRHHDHPERGGGDHHRHHPRHHHAPRARAPPLMPTYPPPGLTRARRGPLWDADGREYLDFLSGLAVTSLGHAHPAVADAWPSRPARLLHVSNLFGTERLGGGAHPRPPARRWRTGVLRQLGGRGQRVRLKLARKFGGAGATSW